MTKRILLSLLFGMLAFGGVLGVTETSWANEEKNLTLPDGLFEGSSNFELRYESGSLDPASLNGSALGVRFYEKGEAFGHAVGCILGANKSGAQKMRPSSKWYWRPSPIFPRLK